MASFADKVKVLIDVDSTGAVSGITKFKQSFSEAEGAAGKFKVVTGAAFDKIKANAAEFGIAAAAAIATFAVKAIGQFQDLALEVDKFANSTGLASEDASRFVEVAGDLGINVEAVAKAINKMNIDLGRGGKAFSELGIEVVKTKDGLVDTNETFITAVGALSKIKDPADRARIATALFGKSWGELSEIIVGGEGKLRAALGSVSEAKIINPQEIARAKELRAAQDALKDAFEDFTITIGQKLIPILTELLNLSGPVFTGLEYVGKGVRIAADALNPLDSAMSGVKRVTDSASSGWERAYGAVQTLGSAIPGVNVALDALGGWLFGSDDKTKKLSASQAILESRFGKVTIAAGKQRYAGLEAANAIAELDDNTNGLIDSFDTLIARLDSDQAIRNMKDRLKDVNQAAIDAFTKGTPEAVRNYQDMVANLVREIAGVSTQLQLTNQDQLRIVAYLEKGEFDRAAELVERRKLALAAKPVVVDIIGRVRGIPIARGDTPSESRRRNELVAGLGDTLDVSTMALTSFDQDTNDLIDSWDSLLDKLDRDDAWDGVTDRLNDLRADIGDVFKKKTPEAVRTAQESMRDLIRSMASVAQQAKLTSDQQLQIKALIDKGDFDSAYNLLKKMLDDLNKEVVIKIKTEDQTIKNQAPMPPTFQRPNIDGGKISLFSTPTLSSIGSSSMAPNVTVNVTGSVISENDLIETVRKGLVNAQRSGKELVYSNY